MGTDSSRTEVVVEVIAQQSQVRWNLYCWIAKCCCFLPFRFLHFLLVFFSLALSLCLLAFYFFAVFFFFFFTFCLCLSFCLLFIFLLLFFSFLFFLFFPFLFLCFFYFPFFSLWSFLCVLLMFITSKVCVSYEYVYFA